MAFFVAEFVLVMQFLWKYIDNIIGKGISLGVIIELIFYFGVRIIPQAVPVTILIASVMVFGNLAEKYEISSLKSAGISLTRIMAGAVVLSILTALFSLFASNYLKPRASYKFKQRYLTVTRKDATLNIEEGVFSQDFKNFTIKVGKKHEDGESIENVLIYDNSGQDKSKINMLHAEGGRMYTDDETQSFVMDLVNGEQYRELNPARKKKGTKPFVRTKFKKWSKSFDTSDFGAEAQDLSPNSSKHDLLNAWQLKDAIDSLDHLKTENLFANAKAFKHVLKFDKGKDKAPSKSELPATLSKAIVKKDKQIASNTNKSKKKTKVYSQQDSLDLADIASFSETFIAKDAKEIVGKAKLEAKKNLERAAKTEREARNLKLNQARYILRFHQQFSWALICIVFLFIGAPLGSIVRKGGYGYPLLIAIIFFMLFIVLDIMGEKLSRTGEINPILAAWLPNIALIPVAFLISRKALNDSDFSANWWYKLKARIGRSQ